MIDADAVVLDLYDTVADGAWGDLMRIILGRIGVERHTLLRALDETRAARSVGTFGSAEGDMSAVIAACGIEPDPALAAQLTKLEGQILPSCARLYHDSLPATRALRAAGIRTALVSNCSHSTRPVVETLGLEGEFDQVVLSFEIGAAKPDPTIYRMALDRLGGVEPSRAVFVDDQVRYCDGAAAFGLRTYLIRRDGVAPVEGRARRTGGHPVIFDLWALVADEDGAVSPADPPRRARPPTPG